MEQIHQNFWTHGKNARFFRESFFPLLRCRRNSTALDPRMGALNKQAIKTPITIDTLAQKPQSEAQGRRADVFFRWKVQTNNYLAYNGSRGRFFSLDIRFVVSLVKIYIYESVSIAAAFTFNFVRRCNKVAELFKVQMGRTSVKNGLRASMNSKYRRRESFTRCETFHWNKHEARTLEHNRRVSQPQSNFCRFGEP